MNGLGWEPYRFQINLTAGDWIFSRTNPDGDFPPGTVAEIKWATGQTWPGEIDGDTVSWRVESADVALIPPGTPYTAWISYPNAALELTDDYPWLIGTCRFILQ